MQKSQLSYLISLFRINKYLVFLSRSVKKADIRIFFLRNICPSTSLLILTLGLRIILVFTASNRFSLHTWSFTKVGEVYGMQSVSSSILRLRFNGMDWSY